MKYESATQKEGIDTECDHSINLAMAQFQKQCDQAIVVLDQQIVTIDQQIVALDQQHRQHGPLSETQQKMLEHHY